MARKVRTQKRNVGGKYLEPFLLLSHALKLLFTMFSFQNLEIYSKK